MASATLSAMLRGSDIFFVLPRVPLLTQLHPGLLYYRPAGGQGSEFRSPTAHRMPAKLKLIEMRALLPKRFSENLGFIGTSVSQKKSLGHMWVGSGGVANLLCMGGWVW